MRKSQNILFLIIFIIVAVAAAGAAVFRYHGNLATVSLPPAVPYDMAALRDKNQVLEKMDAVLPDEVNLNIPFVAQAPHQNWNLPYQQFCEEASALMAASYINNQIIMGPSDADTKLLAVMDFEVKKFGFYEDTNAEQTAVILREHFGLTNISLVSDPTVTDIKKALAERKAVIVPLAGRQLGNPHYQQPGPLYHMIVIKGYRKNGDFITNDPGTRMGADFVYKEDVIMNAIHDWNGGDVNMGRKVILVVG